MEEILAGRWRAFGHLPISVTDPPRWHKDYLGGVDLTTNAVAFGLNHRALASGADIKLIWELSRWHQLTRLAMAAHVLGEAKAGWKCVHWLEHWVQHNQPYRGWNWTSALEAGMRLIQFTWIEALLQPFVTSGECESEMEQLRYETLPSHVWFTWRHRSFGSSANNHLLGELAGLIVATARWPELSRWAVPLDELEELWNDEVLAQFAEDGGNREQALHYHLFSFELCWHARMALIAAGRKVNDAVEQRLERAREFFVDVHGMREPWSYGDSDDAFVLPLFYDESQATPEWTAWMSAGRQGEAISYWIGDANAPLRPRVVEDSPWRLYEDTGVAIGRSGNLVLRYDVSPQGYLTTAAHGHLDALHLSIWIGHTAMIIDPGTGAYYAHRELRSWLACAPAHNGPQTQLQRWPRRRAPFLWSGHHSRPSIIVEGKQALVAELGDGTIFARRSVEISGTSQVLVTDSVRTRSTQQFFTVLWQFPPGAVCQVIEPYRFRVTHQGANLEIVASADWERADLATKPPSEAQVGEGTVSPHFRVVTWAPHLKLQARPKGDSPCVFSTLFLASND